MKTDDIDVLNDKYNKDFNRALNIYENEYSHEELICFLENGSVVEKQVAALKLNSIDSPEEAKIFIKNLTGCDGKIREAVSFRLNEFFEKNPEFFIGYIDILLDAIIDINGNICRNTIGALKYLKIYTSFNDEFCNKLAKSTLKLAKIAKSFNIQEGKYKINKEIFKLYWYLETIYEFAELVDAERLYDILISTKSIIDYTIREKTAKILSKLENEKFSKLKEELKNDQNYYVRRFYK